MAIEARRGCGFRKVGGLYLVSDGGGMPCGRLPHPLHICPTCGHGIKQTRGFTWIHPAELLELAKPCHWHWKCSPSVGSLSCPLADPGALGDRAGLLWIGEKFYSSTLDFNAEASELGISRRIATLPHGFKLGETWVLLAHPKAITDQSTIFDGAPKLPDGFELPGPGVFRIFKPTRLEKIVSESEALDDEAMTALRKRGITPVAVPDDDDDHQ